MLRVGCLGGCSGQTQWLDDILLESLLVALAGHRFQCISKNLEASVGVDWGRRGANNGVAI